MRGGRLMPAPGESADFPALIPPMLAVPARELPAPEAEWAAEFKWDGVRAVAYVSAGGLRLVSRSGRDMTLAYLALQVSVAPADLDHRLIGRVDRVGPGEPAQDRLGGGGTGADRCRVLDRLVVLGGDDVPPETRLGPRFGLERLRGALTLAFVFAAIGFAHQS